MGVAAVSAAVAQPIDRSELKASDDQVRASGAAAATAAVTTGSTDADRVVARAVSGCGKPSESTPVGTTTRRGDASCRIQAGAAAAAVVGVSGIATATAVLRCNCIGVVAAEGAVDGAATALKASCGEAVLLVDNNGEESNLRTGLWLMAGDGRATATRGEAARGGGEAALRGEAGPALPRGGSARVVNCPMRGVGRCCCCGWTGRRAEAGVSRWRSTKIGECNVDTRRLGEPTPQLPESVSR